MLSRRFLLPVATVFAAAAPLLLAQSERHGRKYKAPPETSHLEVLVLRDINGKVLENAAVIFHPTKDGEDEGNLEVKSGTDGKAFIDVIPTGSDVQIQVIANGFSTYAGNIKLDKPSQSLTIRMIRPQQQISAYEDNEGASTRKAGVQEPARVAAPATPKPLSASDPVLKLPTLPAKPNNAKGDSTIAPAKPAPAATPTKTQTNGATPTSPVVDGPPPAAPSN